MNNAVKKIFKKELRETLRDKKSLMMMLIIPFMIPLVVIGFSAFFDMSVNENTDKYNRIGFSYELSAAEIQIAEELGIDTVSKPVLELEKDYNNGEIDLYVTKENNNYIINGNNNEATSYATILVESFFDTYKQYLQMEYLENNQINSLEVINIITLEKNIVDEDNFFITYMLGYAFTFIIMAITVASTYPSTDTTAGEKERGTLETLLTFPIKSRDIIVGKFLTVSLSATITGLFSFLLAIISFIICNNTFEIYKELPLTLSTIGVIYSIVVIIVYSLLISGLCIAIASKSKTFKEAQSSLTPLTFIAVFPGLIVSMIEMESSVLTSIIPFFNCSLIFNDIAAGNVNLLHIILMLVSTILIIVIIFKLIVKQYKSEKILFSI